MKSQLKNKMNTLKYDLLLWLLQLKVTKNQEYSVPTKESRDVYYFNDYE